MINTDSKRFSTQKMCNIALFTVLITICSWISIPTAVPFTLQTFAIFCTLGLLGGKHGTLSILIYLLMGAVGIPVFAEFTGGIGILLRSTGGYLIGFLFLALIYWLITSMFGTKTVVVVIGMFAGLLACYACGTAWFLFVYSQSHNAIGLITVLAWCVLPFLIPDIIKIIIATIVIKRMAPYVRI